MRKKYLSCVALYMLFLSGSYAQSEEALLSDLKSCVEFYWVSTDIEKQIKRNHDTATYFHDGELIVYYDKEEKKAVSKNTIYILNHGFNKLITFQIVSIAIEASNSKKDKTSFITSPELYFDVLYQDSLPKCGRMVIGPLVINVAGYEKAAITAMRVRIEYYNEIIYKWFLKEPESVELPLLNLRENTE